MGFVRMVEKKFNVLIVEMGSNELVRMMITKRR